MQRKVIMKQEKIMLTTIVMIYQVIAPLRKINLKLVKNGLRQEERKEIKVLSYITISRTLIINVLRLRIYKIT